MDTNLAITILRRFKAQVEQAEVDLAEADPDQELSDTDLGFGSLLDGIGADLARLESGIFD